MKATAGTHHCVGRMNDAAERFDQSSLGHFKPGGKRHRINSRHGNELRQTARQARNAVFSIKLALMRVSGLAVATQRSPSGGDAVQALIDDDMLANFKVRDFAANLFDATTNFMPENLRLDIKRNRLAVFVGVVVCMAGKNMSV